MAKITQATLRSLDLIVSELPEAENVVGWVPAGGVSNGAAYPGALALTNKRLIFQSHLGKWILKMNSSVPLDKVTSFEFAATPSSNFIVALTWKQLSIHAQGAIHLFQLDVRGFKQESENFVKLLGECNFGASSPVSEGSGLTSELLALSELFEKGLISPAEFQKAKDKLI